MIKLLGGADALVSTRFSPWHASATLAVGSIRLGAVERVEQSCGMRVPRETDIAGQVRARVPSSGCLHCKHLSMAGGRWRSSVASISVTVVKYALWRIAAPGEMAVFDQIVAPAVPTFCFTCFCALRFVRRRW